MADSLNAWHKAKYWPKSLQSVLQELVQTKLESQSTFICIALFHSRAITWKYVRIFDVAQALVTARTRCEGYD